jgi:hypothetical protein
MGVVMASLVTVVLSLISRSRLTQEDQTWLASASVVALLTVIIQRPLASTRLERLYIRSRFVVSVLLGALVLAVFAGLVVMTALFPQGAALVISMMLLALHLSAWAQCIAQAALWRSRFRHLDSNAAR